MRFFSLKQIHPWLIYLLPISLVTGPFLSDLLCVLNLIFFLIITISNKIYKYYINYFFVIYIFWCLYLISISILSINPYLSLESSLFYFRFGVLSLSVWYLLDNYPGFQENFFKVLLISIIFVCFDSYLL